MLDVGDASFVRIEHFPILEKQTTQRVVQLLPRNIVLSNILFGFIIVKPRRPFYDKWSSLFLRRE